jgi:hypothetical protein
LASQYARQPAAYSMTGRRFDSGVSIKSIPHQINHFDLINLLSYFKRSMMIITGKEDMVW